MRRYVFITSVQIEAETLEDAYETIEEIWGDDSSDHRFADNVSVFAPGGKPDDVYEGDEGPQCSCPTDLRARGGFRSSCQAH
jgi:hypothetical protein